jgi:hypothetical protein
MDWMVERSEFELAVPISKLPAERRPAQASVLTAEGLVRAK